MECGTCHHDNESDAKFCGECGAPLAARCRACDARQPPGSKFCNQCGTPMPGALAPAASTPAPPAAVRKQVTALFADLVGSTAFGERVDPEAARAALAPYFEILRTTVEGHAGTVVKFTGDGVMAIFGIPEVTEDDAVRAVAAGLELQRRFRGFAESVRDRHGLELGLRVGINTGELVIADGDADLVGDVLNTAARIEAVCAPGRVTVGEDTWRLTRSNVSYEVLGEVTVKGKADALATFQVVDDDRPMSEDATPFVGRATELAVLRSAFGDTVAEGVAQLVTVVGAPGVGKTRLAVEMRADMAVRSFDLRFERRGSTTFTPIVELLRELTRSGSPEDVGLLVAGHPEAARLAAVLASFLGHGDARSTEESFWAVRRLLEHLAATEPLVIVVDDIQWAEALFWDLLDHLVEWAEAPVLLVALARPELRELRPELTQAGRRVRAAIALEGLDADTTRELAARLLDTDELPSELIERIPASTEGNPLFVRELVQMLVDDGTLAKVDERWHLTIDADAIEVPPTVLSLLASRVERLPDDERQVVELASVIGTEFDRGELAAIAGPDVSARLGALIDRLRRKDLLEPSGTWAGDHPVYRFHHVLVRDAAYRRLLKGHRADLHERVGRYIDQLGRDRDESGVVVAFHYEQAHRYRAELGTLDGDTRELARLAAGRLRAAADQALERDDLTAAGSLAERALVLTDDDDQRRELLLLGCEALLSSGDVSRGGALVDAMDRDGPDDDRFDAWRDCFRAQLWSLTDADRLAESEALAEAAADRLGALDDQSGVAKARLVRAACLARLGRVGDCEDELDLALGAARAAGDRRRTVAVLGAAPLAALWGPSPVARAGGRCLDVLRLLRITTASPTVEATSVRCQGMLEALRGRLDSARAKLEQSRATAREIGLRQGLFETELFAGLVELLDGDPIAAEPHLRAARDGLGRLGIGADAGQAAALLGRSLLRQGRIDEADDLAGEALASAGQNLQTAIAARAVLAEVRSAQGRHDEAAALIAEAAGIAERTDVVVDHALVELAGIVVADAAHDPRTAGRHRERARQLLDAKGVTLDLAGPSTQSPTAATSTPDDTTTARNALNGDDADIDEIASALIGLPSSDLANAAVDVVRAVVSDLLRDRAILGARFAPGVLFHERRDGQLALGARVTRGRAGVLDAVLEEREGEGSMSWHIEVIAIRGDDLCLVRVDRVVEAAFERTALAIVEVRDSVVQQLWFYDEHALRRAQEELDQIWLDSIGIAEDAPSRRLAPHVYAADADEQALVAHPNLEYREHRRLSFESGDLERFSDNARSMELVDRIVVPRAHRCEPRRSVYERTEVGADGSTSTMLVVSAIEDGLVRWLDVYDPGDLDVALARYDDLGALVAEPVAPRSNSLVNAALRCTLALDRAFSAGDREAALALVHDEFVGDHRERLHIGATLDREQWVDAMIHHHHLGENVRHEVGVIAIRGDDLVLIRNTSSIDGDDIGNLLILQIEDGRLIHARFFEQDQPVEAQMDLDRRYYESIGFGPGTLLWDHCGAAYATDPADVLPILHPDFELSNHRPILRVQIERQGMTAYVAAVHESGDYVTRPRLLATTARTYAYERVEHMGDDYENPEFIVVSVEDGLVRRIDVYATEADAMRRFEELEAGHGSTHEIRNAASDAMEEAPRLRRPGDVDGLRERFHPDFVGRHCGRVFAAAGDMDRDAWIAVIDSVLEAGGRYETDVVAIRGDDLAISRVNFIIGDDVSERIVLTRLDGALLRESVVFEADDLHDALDWLDRSDAELRGPSELRDLLSRARHANVDGDRDAIGQLLAPDFHIDDRRTLGIGDVSRDDYVRTSTRAGTAYLVREIVVDSGRVAVVRSRWIAVDGSSWDQLDVVSYGGGRFEDIVLFDPDDLESARALFEQLTRRNGDGVAHGRALENEASALGRRMHDLMMARDLEGLAGVIDDNFVGHSARRFRTMDSFSFDEFREQWFAVWDTEGTPNDTTETVLAVRGGTLALAEVAGEFGDAVSTSLALVRSAGGRLAELWFFDTEDLPEALDELDRQFESTLGPVTEAVSIAHRGRDLDPATSAPRSCEPTNDAVVAAKRAHALFGDMLAGEQDPASLLSLVHPTYRGHSQTRLRLNEDFDGDQFLAQWNDQFASTGPPTRHDFEPIAVRGSALCLARLALEYDEDHLHRLFITRIEDGLIAEHWWFEPDALHDALDLLNELWTPDGIDPQHGLVESRYRRTFASGTADDFRAVVTDDYVFRDHRKLGLGVRDLDDYLATSGDFFGRGEMIITDVLDWSGPVVLLRAAFRLLGDDQVADPQLLTVTVSRGDRLAVQEPFDPDDLDAARARFAELAAEDAGARAPAPAPRPADVVGSPAPSRWAELAREINEGLSDRDSLLALRDRFHPSFVGRWASTLFAALDDADRDEFLEVTANVIDMGQRLELTISEARDDQLALGAYTIWTDDDVSERLIVMRLDDGLFGEFVVFDQADAEAARAELDRQWHAVSGTEVPDEPLRNLAVDLAMRTRRAIIDDEYDELRRWQTDGFAVRIERRANPYRSLDGDMYVAGIQSTARLGLRPADWEAIEIRGDQLALVRCDMIVPDTGDVLGIVALVHVDAEGRGLHAIEYEPEDIDIARRELDLRWAAMNERT